MLLLESIERLIVCFSISLPNFARFSLNPFQHTFSPGIAEPSDKDHDKENTLYDNEVRLDVKADRPREEEDGLYIKNQKNKSKNIVLGFELN